MTPTVKYTTSIRKIVRDFMENLDGWTEFSADQKKGLILDESAKRKIVFTVYCQTLTYFQPDWSQDIISVLVKDFNLPQSDVLHNHILLHP